MHGWTDEHQYVGIMGTPPLCYFVTRVLVSGGREVDAIFRVFVTVLCSIFFLVWVVQLLN